MSLMAGYTLMTLIVLAICSFAALVRPQARELLAACLFIIFLTYSMKLGVAVTNALGGNVKPPASYVFYPVQDGFSALIVAWSYVRQKATWKLLIGMCFLAQIGGHVAFWGSRDGSVSALYVYTLWNNLGYILTMLTLATTGGGHLVSWVAHLRNRAGVGGLRGVVRTGS